jgi:hypothetical protein
VRQFDRSSDDELNPGGVWRHYKVFKDMPTYVYLRSKRERERERVSGEGTPDVSFAFFDNE